MADGTNELAEKFKTYVNEKYPKIPVVILSALLENDLVKIRNDDGEDQVQEFMDMYGLKESRLDELLEHCSNILSL